MVLKTRADFATYKDYIEYLHAQAHPEVTESMVRGRLTRGWSATRAISTPNKLSNVPKSTHPYKTASYAAMLDRKRKIADRVHRKKQPID